MTNASRQKSYRHHRGSAHRKIDSEHSPKRQPGLRQQAREASGCSQLLAADIAALREDLSRIQGHVKELGTDKSKDTEDIHELSKVALTKIASACYTLSAESIQDVDLMSKVVFSLFSRDLIKVPVSSSPQQDTIELLCQFFISAYKYEQSKENVDADSNLSGTGTITSPSPVDDPDRVKVDILRALSAVLFENGFRLKNSLEDLLEIIVAVGKDTRRQEQSELRRMALNCMANLVCKTGHLLSTYHEQMYELLLANLTITSQFDPSSASGVSSTSRRRDRGSDRKLISSALRALHFLLQEDKRMSTRSLAPFINIVCRFMFYTSENLTMQSTSVSSSTSVFNAGVIQRSVYSSPSTNMVSLVKSAGVGSSNISPSQQHSLDISEPSSFISYRNMQSSDSEYSDSELGAHLSHRRQHDGKVRLNALLCLQALARGAPKQLQPHWPKFLTSSNAAPMMAGTHKAPSLIGLISTDPIFNVRSAACAVLGSILENSKQYLAMAEEERNTAGLSGLAIRNQTGLLALSERIGIMVRELHIGIATAMNALDKLVVEHGVIIPMIKCCSSIVANCSYEKMRPGLALLVWRSIERFMDSNESTLQTATLSFLSALLSNSSATVDTRQHILSFSTASLNASANINVIPELLSKLLCLVESPRTCVAVCLEAWGVLRVIAQYYFDLLKPAWPRLDAALEHSGGGGIEGGNEQQLQLSEDIRVRSAGLFFLEEYTKSGASASDPLASEWWKDVMERHVLKAFAEDNPSIKALGCDCISHLPSDIFDDLPGRLQMLIMSLVLGTALDEHPTARAAACRAIGVFILFLSLHGDTGNMIDMASTVLGLCQDPNLNVRVRASWAVGNLSDSLVLLKNKGAEYDHILEEVLTLPLWTRIIKTALLICQDHEKIKSNGIRAIGGLLRVTFEGILERERHSLVKDAIYTLIRHMEQGSLKGRWNACYAMQNVLLNPDFPIGSTAGTSYALDSPMVSWTKDIYHALLQAIQQSKNFKVRINACAALAVPKTRAKYGDQAMLRHMVQVLMCAVQSLDEKQEDQEFGEFQYRDLLENKLLRCLDHLLQLTGGVASLDLELDPTLRQRIVASRLPPPSSEPAIESVSQESAIS